MALQIGSGAPSAALGADGDYYFQIDPTAGGRFIVGPKANGAWPSTVASLRGSTGPFTLHGNGAPSSTLGAQGQGYVDMATGNTYVKTVSGWGSAIGNILGPQGINGPSGQSVPSLAATSFSVGPMAANATAIALSGSQQALPAPGTTQPAYFTPALATTLVAATFVLSSANNPNNVTFYLVDATAGATRYQYTIGTAGTVANQLNLSVGLVQGNLHYWAVTGSGNAFVQATPVFAQPSSQPIGVTYAPQFANGAALTPTTATAFTVPGTTNIAAYMGVPKTAFLYSASVYNTAGSNATIGLYNAAGTLVWSTSVPAGTNTPTLLGPFGPSTAVLPANYYTWRVTCGSPGFFGVLPQICL